MVLARPTGRGFPAAMVFLSLTGLVAFRSALPAPTLNPIAVVDGAPRVLTGTVLFPVFAPAPTTTTTAVPAPVAVRPAPGPITGVFHERRRGHAHLGIDIDGETGDDVRAAFTGIVLIAGSPPQGYSGYGNIVLIAHDRGLTTMYAHLSSTAVGVGQRVAAGDRVGAMGCTGSCTGSHLHFEVRFGGTPVDPTDYLPGGWPSG
jgi:murein DD-endopeptidase MepM/ murein hydrolase activator NlpD